MVKIAIDARFYGNGHTGLGRYTTNVLKYLPHHLPGHTLQVLLRDAEYDHFPSGKNIVKVHAEIPHYSVREQLMLPRLLSDLGSDLLYTLHFNSPIFAKIKTIITVHDLIKSHFTGADTTTRAPWLYGLKRLGYNQVIKSTLEHASDIIVPTNTVKNDILSMFGELKPERIHPICEAPDEIFRQNMKLANLRFELPSNYILFVGNVYPHKNLSVLLKAMQTLKDFELVIVTKNSPFLSRVLAPYDRTHIHIFESLTDRELYQTYARARLLVTPSLMEGYGLVGLEALMLGIPAVASNIPVYREVYGDRVTYFDPTSPEALVHAVGATLAVAKRKKFKFDRTWDNVAQDIAEVIHARSASL